MSRKPTKLRSDCPLSYTLDLLGDKWTLLIIRDLLLYHKSHYNEFLKSDEKISTNILADRLQRLEEHQIITKSPDTTHRSKVVYGLTQKGIDLLPILLEMFHWGATYSEGCPLPDDFMQSIVSERPQLMQKIISDWEASSTS